MNKNNDPRFWAKWKASGAVRSVYDTASPQIVNDFNMWRT